MYTHTHAELLLIVQPMSTRSLSASNITKKVRVERASVSIYANLHERSEGNLSCLAKNEPRIGL